MRALLCIGTLLFGCSVPRAGLSGDGGLPDTAIDVSTDRSSCLPTGEPTDICNGFDDDCDGLFDEDETSRGCVGRDFGDRCINRCEGGVFAVECVHSESSTSDECGNLVDDDCDGTVDETCDCETGASRPCGCDGMQRCEAGMWASCMGERTPDAERCNSADDDCDGVTDEDPVDAEPQYRDRDEDGYGDGATTIASCAAVTGYVSNADDCDDGSADSRPGGTEVCGGGDEDCDTRVDESVGPLWYRDMDGDGYGDATMSIQACAMPAGFVADDTDCNDDCERCHPDYPTDVCGDSLDNDCDDDVDGSCECSFADTGSGLYLLCDDVALRWGQARTYCMNHGGDLVSINSSTEQDDVWALMDPTGDHFWIGGEDVGRDGTWEWVDGSAIASCEAADSDVCMCLGAHCDFRSGKPDNSSDHCLWLDKNQGGAWDDKPCSDSNPFVCEL